MNRSCLRNVIASASIGATSMAALAGPDCSRIAESDEAIVSTRLDSHRVIERQANVFTSSAQDRGAVASTPGGEFVVIWDSRRQERGTYGVFAQRFDAIGRPIGDEIHINQTLNGHQFEPAVACGPEGEIWTAWTSSGQDGSGGAIVARRFVADFEDSTSEIAVNQKRLGDQRTPSIAVNDRGEVMVVWISERRLGGGGSATAIKARFFDATGKATSDEIQLSPHDVKRHLAPSVTAMDDNGFMVVWSRAGIGDESAVVLGRRVGADRVVEEEAIVISDDVHHDQIEPAVTATPDGGFIAAWQAATRNGYDVRVRRFDKNGEAATESCIVATPDGGWKNGVAVAAARDGRFVMAWNSDGADGDGAAEGVIAQLFNASGEPEGDPFAVNRHTHGRQTLAIGDGAARITWTDRDQLAFAWTGESADGDSSSVNLTVYSPKSIESLAAPKPSERRAAMFTDADMQAAIPPLWDPDFVPQAPWRPTTLGEDFGFEGVPGTGWYPPDPEMAVGPEHIMLMTNGQIACFTKDGVNVWRDEIELSTGFWGSVGATWFVFDPEVAWDPHSERFLAMACERSDDGRSKFLLAVSKDDRPETDTDWWKYRIDVTSEAGNDIDSPNLAVNLDHVYLTADFFSPTDEYLVYVIEKAPLLSGGAVNANHELISGSGQQSMGIPVMWDADAPAQYIIQSTEFNSNNTVIFHAVTDPLTNYQRQTFTLSVPTYSYPAPPPQRGSGVRPWLFEPRFWSCVYRDGSLWATHHVNSNRARARWYEFAMNGWPASGSDPELIQWGEIDLGDGISTFFPSINVDAAGNAAMTFARSATDEYISMSRAVRLADDPAGTFRDSVIVQESLAPSTGGRWGDYSFTHPDEWQAGSFWGHHEFTTSGGTTWRTWVARYDLGERLDLQVGPLFAGQNGDLDVTGATPGVRVFFGYSLTGEGSVFIPPLNVTIDLDQPQYAGSARANAAGEAHLSVAIPPIARNRTVWIQAAQVEAVSNVVQTQVN